MVSHTRGQNGQNTNEMIINWIKLILGAKVELDSAWFPGFQSSPALLNTDKSLWAVLWVLPLASIIVDAGSNYSKSIVPGEWMIEVLLLVLLGRLAISQI